MDWGVLIVIGVVAWTVVAFGIGMLFGRVVRRRDRESPDGDHTPQRDDDAGPD